MHPASFDSGSFMLPDDFKGFNFKAGITVGKAVVKDAEKAECYRVYDLGPGGPAPL
jgi:hypothetical protein